MAGIKFEAEGYGEFQKTLNDLKSSLKVLGSELKVVKSEFDKDDTSVAALTAKNKALNSSIEKQKELVNHLAKGVAEATTEFGENDKRTQDLTIQYNKAKASLNGMEREVSKNKDTMRDYCSSFLKLGSAIDDAEDDAKDFAGELKSVDKRADECEKSVNGLGKEAQGLGNDLENTGKKSSIFGEMLKANLTSEAIIGGIKKIGHEIVELGKTGIEYNSQMENYTTNFRVMLGSQEDAIKEVTELKKMAAKTPFGMEDLAEATQTLISFQVPAQKVNEILSMLGDVALGDKQKLSGLALVFGQVSSAGKLQGQDLMQLINQGFNPLNYIAQRTGESMGQLRDRMSEGGISAKEVEQAFEDATSAGGMFYKGMDEASKTFDGQMSTLKDNLHALIGEAFEPMSDMLKNELIPDISRCVDTLSSGFADADEVVSGLNESLKTTGDVQKLIDKYQGLSKEVKNTSLSSEELTKKTAELEQSKQDLIKVSGGVVTAFDIENGTFDKQVSVLKDVTKNEQDYIKYKLLAQVTENSGVSAVKKSAKATEEYAAAQKNLNSALERQRKNNELEEKGQLRDTSKNFDAHYVEKWQNEMASATKTLEKTKEDAAAAESAIQSLSKSGMSASEIAEKTGLSIDEVNTALGRTSTAAESTIPEVQSLKEQMYNLEAEYEAAKATISATLDGIITGWGKVPPAVAVSADQVIANLQSQLDWMSTYRENLDALMSRQIPGVDMSAMIASLSDGSAESAAILAGMKGATDDQVAQIAQSMGGIKKGKEAFVDEVAAAQVNYDERMAGMVDTTVDSVKKMDLSDEAKASAINTINGYIIGIQQQSGPLNLTMTNAARDAMAAWKKELDEHSPSRKMITSGENTMKGAIIGVQNMQGELERVYTEVGEQLLVGLSVGMQNGSGKAMDTVDDVAKELAQRVSNIASIFSISSDIYELQYNLWESTVGKSASAAEKSERKLGSLNAQAELQKKHIDEVQAAYKKMVEIYGKDGAESLKLQKQLLQEQLAYEKLKKSIDEVANAKSSVNADKLANLADQEYKLWFLNTPDATDVEKLEKQSDVLTYKLDLQTQSVSDTEAAFADAAKQYGVNSDESIKLQEQLLKEKIAYTELKKQIDEATKALSQYGVVRDMAKISSSFSGLKSAAYDTAPQQLSAQAVGGMISNAVNALGTMNGGQQTVVVQNPLYINGRELARATVEDFRVVEASSPQVRSDRF